jgi:Spy/CpxP family protein refolding chaperone
VDALAQDLNLSGAQIEKMQLIFERFAEKQSLVPTPGQVLLDNKDMLREVLTSKEFERQKAEHLVDKVTAIIQMATVNRLELRHDLYQQLTPDQQQQYISMVQAKVADLLQ